MVALGLSPREGEASTLLQEALCPRSSQVLLLQLFTASLGCHSLPCLLSSHCQFIKCLFRDGICAPGEQAAEKELHSPGGLAAPAKCHIPAQQGVVGKQPWPAPAVPPKNGRDGHSPSAAHPPWSSQHQQDSMTGDGHGAGRLSGRRCSTPGPIPPCAGACGSRAGLGQLRATARSPSHRQGQRWQRPPPGSPAQSPPRAAIPPPTHPQQPGAHRGRTGGLLSVAAGADAAQLPRAPAGSELTPGEPSRAHRAETPPEHQRQGQGAPTLLVRSPETLTGSPLAPLPHVLKSSLRDLSYNRRTGPQTFSKVQQRQGAGSWQLWAAQQSVSRPPSDGPPSSTAAARGSPQAFCSALGRGDAGRWRIAVRTPPSPSPPRPELRSPLQPGKATARPAPRHSPPLHPCQPGPSSSALPGAAGPPAPPELRGKASWKCLLAAKDHLQIKTLSTTCPL